MNLNLTLISGEEMRAASAFITLLADIREGYTKDGAILGAIIQKGLDSPPPYESEAGAEYVAQAQKEAEQAVLQPHQEAAEPVKEATKRTRKPKSEPEGKSETSSESASAAASLDGVSKDLSAEPISNASQPKSVPLSIDDVRAALQRYTAVHGMQDGIVLLKNYGAGRISELTEEQYPLFIAECDAKDE